MLYYLAIVANFARTGVAVRSRGAPLVTPSSLLQAAFLRKWLGKPAKVCKSYFDVGHYNRNTRNELVTISGMFPPISTMVTPAQL